MPAGRPPANPAPEWAERIIEKAMGVQAMLMDLNREIENVINGRALKNKRPRSLEVA